VWYIDAVTSRAEPTKRPQVTKQADAPGRRAAWGSISREQVIAAATKAVKAGGYEEMTIRSLATELKVAPMSLYRHVRDKDDLLDEVVDRLLSRAWQPRANESDWQAWVAEAADKLRRFLVTQPAALHVYLRHPVVSPAAIARMNAMMDVLRQALLDEQMARRAYGAIHTYTIGFAALEGSRAGWQPTDADDEMARQLAAYTTSRQFAIGLRYLLEGIARDAPIILDEGGGGIISFDPLPGSDPDAA
jgi:AcrR family transcriptional regulator